MLDIVKDVGPNFRSGSVLALAHTVSLERTEETLNGLTVCTTARGAHAADEAALQETLALVAGELTAPI